jgi:hypothetical protein
VLADLVAKHLETGAVHDGIFRIERPVSPPA